MRATVETISAEVDLASWRPEDPGDVGIPIRLAIGPANENFADEFELTVCTPRWLARAAAARSPLLGVHHVVVPEWNYPRLERWLDTTIRSVEAPIWADLAVKLGRLARWSHEDDPSVDVGESLCLSCGFALSENRYTDHRCPACDYRPGVIEGQTFFTPAEWRGHWVARGMPWTSTRETAAPDWDAGSRLRALDLLARRDTDAPARNQQGPERAVVGDIMSPDAELDTFRPEDPAFVNLFIQVFVGAPDQPAGEALNLEVSTPAWLEAAVTGPMDCRHRLIVDHWDFPQIERFIRSYVSELRGHSWDDLGRQFGRLGYWEFEDLAQPWGPDL